MDGTAANACSKAAAWVWYQRGSGSSAMPASARSKVALVTPHRSVRGAPSRFKLEADLLLASLPIEDATDRLESLHLVTNSANSSCGHGSIAADMLAPLMQQVNSIGSYPCASTDLIVAAPSSYGAAVWDCGSALFDSFELVAVSKKLDSAHQLNGAVIEKICPPPEDTTIDMQCETLSGEDGEEEADEETHRGQLLHDSPPLMSMKDPPWLGVTSNTIQDQRQSRQAIYDMFCHYDNPWPEGGILEDANHSSLKHTKKLKPGPMPPAARSRQYQKRRLHSLSKAFRQQIAQLAGLSKASSMPANQPLEKGHLHQSLPSTDEASTQARHPHYHNSVQAVSPKGGIQSSGSPFRGCPQPESSGIKVSNHTLRKHDYVHHHHHHHYHHHHHHYLFRRHLEEAGIGVLPEPLLGADKSLLVAAAGLGTTKLSALQDYLSLNPKLDGALLDYKRKLKDPNMPPSTVPFSSPPNLQL